MIIDYEIPTVPNFVRTKQGVFSLGDLSEEELTEYAEIWCQRLKERREEILSEQRGRTMKQKHICSFTKACDEEVHECPYEEASNHCECHCWYGDM